MKFEIIARFRHDGVVFLPGAEVPSLTQEQTQALLRFKNIREVKDVAAGTATDTAAPSTSASAAVDGEPKSLEPSTSTTAAKTTASAATPKAAKATKAAAVKTAATKKAVK